MCRTKKVSGKKIMEGQVSTNNFDYRTVSGMRRFILIEKHNRPEDPRPKYPLGGLSVIPPLQFFMLINVVCALF